jgi:hypothetical protein
VRFADGGAVTIHNNEQLPTLKKYRLTYLNACPSTLTFDATFFYLMHVCALSVYRETGKQGTRFDPRHPLTYPDF